MEPRRGLALTLAAAALWGTSFPANRIGLDDADPFTFMAVRFAIGFAVLLPVALRRGARGAALLRSPWVWGVALANALGYELQFVGQQLTTPGQAALLINAGNLAVPLFAFLLLGERLQGAKAPAVLLAALGVLLIGSQGDVANLRGASLLGTGIVLVAGLCWAAVIALNKRALAGHDPVALSTAVVGLTALLALPGALLLGHPALHAPGLGAAAYAGVMCTSLAFLLWSAGLQVVSSVTSGLLLLLEILVAFALSLALGLEALTSWNTAGALCIGGAIVLAAWGAAARSPRASLAT
jgi:drug/metabolite transporter (DMT)-like permease